jgi:hypothetical protein
VALEMAEQRQDLARIAGRVGWARFISHVCCGVPNQHPMRQGGVAAVAACHC